MFLQPITIASPCMHTLYTITPFDRIKSGKYLRNRRFRRQASRCSLDGVICGGEWCILCTWGRGWWGDKRENWQQFDKQSRNASKVVNTLETRIGPGSRDHMMVKN